jgi:phage baseplate assembly protein W
MVEANLILGTDLELDESYHGADLSSSRLGDLNLVSDEMNLAQAILHRLRTIKGELADIGHPDYGSNLYDLIGEPNNQITRDRLKVIVRSTIREEPRIREVVKVEVKSRLEILEKKEGKQTLTSRHTLSKGGAESEGRSSLQEANTYEEDRRALAASVDVDITVIPIDSNVPLNIVFPFYLEVV